MANTRDLLIKEISRKKKANIRQSNKDSINSSQTAPSA
jgi:hypothetical protein